MTGSDQLASVPSARGHEVYVTGADARYARFSEEQRDRWAALLDAPFLTQEAPSDKVSRPQRAAGAEHAYASGSGVASEESVSVVVREKEVGIVVRDTKLEPQAALQAAFVVAQDLTGRRDTLRLLMVNGRTLYRARDAPPSPVPLIRC
jgi:hypothetical protein